MSTWHMDKVARIKETGAKASHPNDGWVDRDENGTPLSVVLCYPDYQYPIEIGDLIGLTKSGGSYTLHRVVGWKDNPWAGNRLRSRKYFIDEHLAK